MNSLSIYKRLVNDQLVQQNEVLKSDKECAYEYLATATTLQFENKAFKVSVGDYLDQYNEQHLEEGWLKRKFIAIPMSLYSATLLPLAHLAKAFFYSMIGNKNHSKAAALAAARDIQESKGWLTTLFSDKTGSFILAEANFMKKCYEIRITKLLDANNPLMQQSISQIKNKITEKLKVLSADTSIDPNEIITLFMNYNTELGPDFGGTQFKGTKKEMTEYVLDALFSKTTKNAVERNRYWSNGHIYSLEKVKCHFSTSILPKRVRFDINFDIKRTEDGIILEMHD